MKEDLSKFEKVSEEMEIIKETEKAIAVEQIGYYGASTCGYETRNLKWIPKSVAKIENNKLVALKGWFIDKNCLDMYQLVSEEALARFEAKYCKKSA